MTSAPLAVYAIAFADPSERIQRGLASVLSVNIHHVPAVEAATEPTWTDYSDATAIGPGAAGAYLAHRSAWRRLADECGPDTYGLVLEDDAVLTPYGRRWLGRVVEEALRNRWNFIQLGTNRSDLHTGHVVSPSNLEHRFEMMILERTAPRFTQALRSCNYASLVRSDFAGWLASARVDFAMPVDNWLRALALDPSHRMRRVRQTVFLTEGRASDIDARGRMR